MSSLALVPWQMFPYLHPRKPVHEAQEAANVVKVAMREEYIRNLVDALPCTDVDEALAKRVIAITCINQDATRARAEEVDVRASERHATGILAQDAHDASRQVRHVWERRQRRRGAREPQEPRLKGHVEVETKDCDKGNVGQSFGATRKQDVTPKVPRDDADEEDGKRPHGGRVG
ncbi:hypothetical protein PsorP6_016538 [Peronosclerospora sorghi]|uniref:Uncharacterized protein n=1 Tax=Peronosclerospora sorghi TaxID=230839 RepID=A0ACC0VQS6_9STRA|nr:hypothetical protein PsorP6_016538 [Peronosclerospora sorghi]